MSLLSLRWSGEYELSPEQERARRFHQHVLADVDYPKSISYNLTRFLAIIAQDGSAVTAAKKLFLDPAIPRMFPAAV